MTSNKSEKKLKVAMIGLRGIPANSGGVEVVVENLAPILAELGADVTVYCRNPYCKEKPESFKGVKLKYLPVLNTKHTEALSHSFLATLDSLFRSYDIVHYHAMGNAIFSFIPKLAGKKTVVTIHGLDWEREKWGKLATMYLKLSEMMIASLPNKVISVSSRIKEYYHQKYNKEIAFIPNGINIEKKAKLSALSGIRNDSYILFLSRIVPEKGVHYLIEAFKKIDTELKLVIAGNSTHTDSYLAKVKEMAKDDTRIIFTGPLYGKKKIEAFSNARLFVLPSTIEGMPIVLLESMSFGLCPLVSDIPENTAVIGSKAFSFKSKDSDDLRKRLQYLIENPGMTKAAGIECRQRVKEDYPWETVAKKTFDIYKDMLIKNGK